MKSFLTFLILFTLFSSKAIADATLREIKGPNIQKRYLEYVIPQNENSGTYKIWNLTQNKQVGADITKSSSEVSDIINFEGNTGDKYTIIDSSGEVIAAFSDGTPVAKASQISGSPANTLIATATTPAATKNTNNKKIKISNLHKNTNGAASGATAMDKDQITYINAQKKSYEDMNRNLKARVAERKGQLKILLKKNSEQEINNLCNGKVTTSKGKTLSVITRCEDLQTLEENLKTSESNLSQLTKYQEEATKSLGTSTNDNTATNSNDSNSQPSQKEATSPSSSTCSPIKVDAYSEYRMRSSAVLFSDTITPGSLDNNSMLSNLFIDGNLKGAAATEKMLEASKHKDIFLDGCYLYDFNSKDHARDSSLQYKYTKISGSRRLNLSCENGAPTPSNNAPIKTFEYDSMQERIIKCPVERHEVFPYNKKYGCGARTEYADQNSIYMFGDRFESSIGDFFSVWVLNDPVRLNLSLKMFQGLNLNAKNPEDLLPETDRLESLSCLVDDRIYLVNKKFIFECTDNEAAPFKFIGAGRFTYKDVTDEYKRSIGTPFSALVGHSGTWEEILAKYPKCSEYKINLSEGFNTTKEKKLDGIYASSSSNEDFKIEEKIGISRIIIRGLSGYAEYKAMADKKGGEKIYTGQGVDYPGTCKDIAPFSINIERVSDDELKITQTMLEDSCGLKKDSQTSFTLKRK